MIEQSSSQGSRPNSRSSGRSSRPQSRESRGGQDIPLSEFACQWTGSESHGAAAVARACEKSIVFKKLFQSNQKGVVVDQIGATLGGGVDKRTECDIVSDSIICCFNKTKNSVIF